jgi:hypothetical protein
VDQFGSVAIFIIVVLAIVFSLFGRRRKRKGEWITDGGFVKRVLDDRDGHQRFILKMEDGRDLLVTHNIEIGSRLNGLKAGDHVTFYGELINDSRGGIVHWTHRDPKGWHDDGWLLLNLRTYK